jgi:hypothetical protein
MPLWATTANNISVISISGIEPEVASTSGVAFRLRLRDQDGAAVFAANVYLRLPQDTWTAALTPGPDGSSILSTADPTCALMERDGLVSVLDPQNAIPAQLGYLEVFAMASPEDLALRLMILQMDCEGLAEKWNAGAWATQPSTSMRPPDGPLRGSVQVVDVPKGSSYVIEATALTGFTNISQHFRPGNEAPNLGTAHDAGTPQGATRSRLCSADRCIEDTWSEPSHAVAAALMVHRLSGDYSREPNLAAKSEVVITYPLRHLLDDESDVSHAAIQIYDRHAAIYELPSICMPVWEFCHPIRANHNRSIGVISMNLGFAPHEPETTSEIVHIPSSQNFPTVSLGQLPVAGWFRVGFERAFAPYLIGSTGRRYYGEPAIAITLQEFSNGNLAGPDGVTQRANYGLTRLPTRQLWPESHP